MLTGVALIPQTSHSFGVGVLCCLRYRFCNRAGPRTYVRTGRPSPGAGLHTGAGGRLHTVPVACQNEAQTADIERYPDDDQTSRDQQSSSWRLPGKRPPKR